MAKKSTYPKWAIVAMAGGACLTGVEVYGAVGYLVGQSQPSYLVVGGAIVTLVAAGLPMLAGRCFHHGRYLLAALLWVAMVPALSLIVGAAVERTGGARDEANRDRQAIAQRIELTRAAEKEAKAEVEAAEAKATAECSSAAKGVDPRGPKCKAAESRAVEKRAALRTAREDVAQAGVIPRDPQAVRFAALFPGLTEEAVTLYYPLILPLAISALGLLLIAAGAHSPKPVKVIPRKGKRKKRRRYTKRQTQPRGNVIPLRKRA